MRITARLWNDEHGMVVSAELVLVATVAVLSVLVGLDALAQTVNFELKDAASAVTSLNQSDSVSGLQLGGKAAGGGSGFLDASPVSVMEATHSAARHNVDVRLAPGGFAFDNHQIFQDSIEDTEHR